MESNLKNVNKLDKRFINGFDVYADTHTNTDRNTYVYVLRVSEKPISTPYYYSENVN